MYRCASAASQTRLSSMRDSSGCTEGMGQQTTLEWANLYVHIDRYINACSSVDPPH